MSEPTAGTRDRTRGRRIEALVMPLLAFLIRRAGGRHWIPTVFDRPRLPPGWSGRFGVTVPPSEAADWVTVLPALGADVVEVGPVGDDDVATVRGAATGRRCQVIAVVGTTQTAAAIDADVDAVRIGDSTDVVRLVTPDLDAAVQALANPSSTVLAVQEVLLTAGPWWFSRVIDAATSTTPPAPLRETPRPRRWPGWLWAGLVAIGLIVAGLGAGAIALGPVLLPYDRAYLDATVADLHAVNDNLVGFLQHDRITMAGNMIGLGVLYLCLAQAMRQGFRWARRTLLISGLVAFASYFYFLGTGGFVEPLHTLVVVVLAPMLVAAVWRPLPAPGWPAMAEGPESQRRRAFWGQLLMIGVGVGLTGAGLVISTVGLTTVFVPTDLDFMGTHAGHLDEARESLLPFIAHDRAGFGGALIGAGLAVTLISLWGWRRGQRWVWWCLLVGCSFGTVPVLAVHFTIGYTHFEHLLPVYLLVVAAVAALTMAKNHLTDPVGR